MNETIKSIKELLIRDLDRLTVEIEAYKNEANIWKLSGDISNSSGNLCLHLCGNLKHFIGATIGNNSYIRKRKDEFNLKNIPKAKLIQNISETKQSIISSLDNFDERLLNQPFPIEVFGKPMSHILFLIHLTGHLNYHLGQINYLRRLVN